VLFQISNKFKGVCLSKDLLKLLLIGYMSAVQHSTFITLNFRPHCLLVLSYTAALKSLETFSYSDYSATREMAQIIRTVTSVRPWFALLISF